MHQQAPAFLLFEKDQLIPDSIGSYPCISFNIGGESMGRKKLDRIKSTVSELFELPKEITLNFPKISMVGNNQMLVENHKGVIEYIPQKIRVNSGIGVIRVQGTDMVLRNIAADDIMITGNITMIEFLS